MTSAYQFDITASQQRANFCDIYNCQLLVIRNNAPDFPTRAFGSFTMGVVRWYKMPLDARSNEFVSRGTDGEFIE